MKKGNYKIVVPKGKEYDPGEYFKGNEPCQHEFGDPGYQVKKALKSKAAKEPKEIIDNII